MPNIRRIRKVWIWIVWLFLALFLLSSNVGIRRSWNPLEQAIVEITAPFQGFIGNAIRTTKGIWLKYFDLIQVHNENVRLKKELDDLRRENDRFRELLATSKRLQQLLRFKETLTWPVLAAQVIGRDPTGWFKSVIVDKGKRSGLQINMPVVDARGVVGRLVSVSPNYAKVLLIIDQNSAVDCVIQRSREKGIMKGFSPKICKLDYVLKTGDVVVGDVAITSGLGGVYPKGLPVGEVVEVGNSPGELFQDIKVRPVVDFSKLEELLVVMKEQPLLRESKDRD
ncbi:MAG: rod shape-determining protein MreC [Deltaproteobacteria bacterium]|nr:rod shape-determining protein MreC [Deltaproteobacteria bacterium]